VTLQLLIALIAVLALGRVLGRALRQFGQPPVIGEVLAGIALGPSLLGQVVPAGTAFLASPDVTASISPVAQLGVILYMFLVGVDLDLEALRRQARATVLVAQVGVVVPFLLGTVIALAVHQRYAPHGVSRLNFALFIGVAMAVTAFPVLARILSDRELDKTEIGRFAMACAAMSDVTAWCLLAGVVGIARSRPGDGIVVAAATIGYTIVMISVVRPIAVGLMHRVERQRSEHGTIALVLIATLISAAITDAIGVHAIFGAFLMGLVIPSQSRIARAVERSIQDIVGILLLPAFFALAGLRTDVTLLSGWDQWTLCLTIIALAVVGKFATAVPARLLGFTWRNAAAVGALMNTRGLMELVALNVGLDFGVISQTLFTMFVIMAITTTMSTGPLLHLLRVGRQETS
jgi:K+:H+ antiporter